MGCFFGCFRSKDSTSNLYEHPVSGSKNALSSLFLSDVAVPQQSKAKSHKDEVKLVKTLLETPTEIQKPSEKWKAPIGEEKSSRKLKSGESPSSQQVNQSELAGSVTELLLSLEYINNATDEKVSEDSLQCDQSVLQSVENTPKLKALKDESTSQNIVGNDMADEGSLSSWFKPISAPQNSNNKKFDSTSAENVHLGESPEDRPILGMVAAYWKDDEPSDDIPPKLRDGNGIPNSTNKYKEDQKVSFHTTPFEERLEKALSEETCTSRSQRKPINGASPLKFHETEEFDTASSHLRPDES